MKKHVWFLLPFFALVCLTDLHAKVFQYEKSAISHKTPQELKERILDFSHMCSQGCPYYYSPIDEAKIFINDSPEDMVVWFKTNRGGHSYFSHVTVKEEDQGHKILILTTLLSGNDVHQWEKKSSLNHHSFFHQMNSSWTLEEVRDANQQFLHTVVKHHTSAAKDGFVATIGGSKIYEAMKESADEKMNLVL